jgi:uncharacterized membrane-anchored protein YitT (DUF2179 family)
MKSLIRLYDTSRDYILILCGVFSAGLGLKGFLLPNEFTDGGITGISILTSIGTGIPLSVLIFLFNIPFLYLGYKQLSLLFTIKTFIGITTLALCTYFVPYPVITHDKLLIAVFGGFFLGTGIGLAIRGGGVIDGTEVLALDLSRRTVLSIGDIILFINIIIFAAAIFVLSFEKALYSILTYIVASKTVDFIIHGIEEYKGVTIISTKPDEIRRAIIDVMGRGVTIFKGERGYTTRTPGSNPSDYQLDIIFCVVTRLEVSKLKTIIDKLDPNAFITEHTVTDIKGGVVKRRPFSH